MNEQFGGKKWDVSVQTQAEAARNIGVARMDAKATKEQEDRQRVLNALTQHGGMAGISVPKLKEYLPFSKETVAQRLRELERSHSAEVCGSIRGGDLWRASCYHECPPAVTSSDQQSL